MSMQAILLATAKTDRLHPLSETIPSPVLPIAGRPVMAYSLELLARQDCKRIHVSLYNSGNYIEAYFGSGSRWGINLEYLLQPNDWGSAGSVRWARQHLIDSFVVMPADMLVDLDLNAIVEQHKSSQSAATVVLTSKRPVPLQAQQENPSKSDIKKPATGECVETGIFVLDPKVIDFIPSRAYFDISTQLIPALIAAGLPVQQVMSDGYWNPLETFADYLEAQKTVLDSALAKQSMMTIVPFIRYPAVEGRQIRKGVWIGHDSSIHPLARLRPPIFIANNCYIRKGVDLGPHAIIGNNVIIDEDATVANSTVLDHTYVGQLVNLVNRVVNKKLLIDGNSGETVYISDQHLLSETYRIIDDSGLARLAEFSFALLALLVSLPISLIISLLLLVFSGRVFRWFPRIHMAPSDPGTLQEPEYKSFKLLRFATRNAKGKESWIGKVLERWELYRLPELWNIIKGDIRLVGVKPLSPEENSLVKEAWQKTRYEASPGFTGLWYVQTTSGSNFDEILVSDAYYAATRTWNGDIKLVFQSILAWFRRL
ncbi:MAG: sugar transferase [Anaerolineaceae bacterium]|nr:sugar transferase [Anaerolineaceae bacterium]